MFSLSVYTFFGGPVSRYRQSFSACLVLLAAVGACEARERLTAGRFHLWTGGWALLNVLLWVFGQESRRIALWLKELARL